MDDDEVNKWDVVFGICMIVGIIILTAVGLLTSN